MVTLPLTLSIKTFIGLRGVLTFKGTFPIGNLIPGLRFGFFKDTLFQKLWSHFLGFYFLFYFPFKNKNKISGDSNFFFFKNQFFTNKKASLADRVGTHVKNAGPHHDIQVYNLVPKQFLNNINFINHIYNHKEI